MSQLHQKPRKTNLRGKRARPYASKATAVYEVEESNRGVLTYFGCLRGSTTTPGRKRRKK